MHTTHVHAHVVTMHRVIFHLHPQTVAQLVGERTASNKGAAVYTPHLDLHTHEIYRSLATTGVAVPSETSPPWPLQPVGWLPLLALCTVYRCRRALLSPSRVASPVRETTTGNGQAT